MKTEMECIKCFCDSLFHQLGKLELSPEAKTATAREVMRRISDADFDLPPPLIAAQVNQVISAAAGETDRFRKEKELSTQCAHELLESIRPDLEKAPDRFAAYVLLAIAGNIIDFGVDCNFDLGTAREKIIHALSEPFDRAGQLRRSGFRYSPDRIVSRKNHACRARFSDSERCDARRGGSLRLSWCPGD